MFEFFSQFFQDRKELLHDAVSGAVDVCQLKKRTRKSHLSDFGVARYYRFINYFKFGKKLFEHEAPLVAVHSANAIRSIPDE